AGVRREIGAEAREDDEASVRREIRIVAVGVGRDTGRIDAYELGRPRRPITDVDLVHPVGRRGTHEPWRPAREGDDVAIRGDRLLTAAAVGAPRGAQVDELGRVGEPIADEYLALDMAVGVQTAAPEGDEAAVVGQELAGRVGATGAHGLRAGRG